MNTIRVVRGVRIAVVAAGCLVTAAVLWLSAISWRRQAVVRDEFKRIAAAGRNVGEEERGIERHSGVPNPLACPFGRYLESVPHSDTVHDERYTAFATQIRVYIDSLGAHDFIRGRVSHESKSATVKGEGNPLYGMGLMEVSTRVMTAFRPIDEDLTELRSRGADWEGAHLHSDGGSLNAVFTLGRAVGARCAADIVQGRNSDAFADARILFSLGHALNERLGILDSLTEMELDRNTIEPLFLLGLKGGVWDEGQVAEFQRYFVGDRALAAMKRALYAQEDKRLDLAGSMTLVEFLRGHFGSVGWKNLDLLIEPPGLSNTDIVVRDRLNEAAAAAFHPEDGRIDGKAIQREIDAARIALGADFKWALEARVAVEEAKLTPAGLSSTVAVALVHYKRDYGAYPETLEALVPNYAATIPADPATGKPPVYTVRESGKFMGGDYGRQVSFTYGTSGWDSNPWRRPQR